MKGFITGLGQKPILNFFLQIIGLVVLTVIVVLLLGIILDWSGALDYSNGFFYACVVMAGVGSVRAIMMRPGMYGGEMIGMSDEVVYKSKIDRFFASRSGNFKMLVAAVFCLLVSIFVAQ